MGGAFGTGLAYRGGHPGAVDQVLIVAVGGVLVDQVLDPAVQQVALVLGCGRTAMVIDELIQPHCAHADAGVGEVVFAGPVGEDVAEHRQVGALARAG